LLFSITLTTVALLLLRTPCMSWRPQPAAVARATYQTHEVTEQPGFLQSTATITPLLAARPPGEAGP
jgi:hypothetical protein